MSFTLVDTATVTPSDRLTLTVCLAILVHAIVILGVSFVSAPRSQPSFETIEIVLVNSRSKDRPEEPKLLAQANQAGGGEETRDVRPATPMVTPVPAAMPSVPTAPILALVFDLPAPPPETPLEATPEPAHPDVPTETQEADQEATAVPILVAEATTELPQRTAERSPEIPDKPRTAGPQPRQDEPAASAPAATPAAATAATSPRPSGAALVARSFAIASLDAEIADRMEAKAKRPRRRFISATTAEYKYAAYMEAWRQKVERIGNLNYPDEARRQRLSGSLILDVALNADGSISEITVRRPSGSAVLDDAAIRIVRLAAPYSAFPETFANEVDILHITRTWQFKSGARFASQ